MADATDEAGYQPLMFPQFGKGRCINCGFLYKHAGDATSAAQYIEAGSLDRSTGNLFGGSPRTFPECHLSQVNFADEDEVGWAAIELADEAAAKAVFERLTFDRACSMWFAWQEGWPPQRHREEVRMLEQQQRWKDWQAERHREHRDWMAAQAEIARTWQEGQEDRRRQWEQYLSSLTEKSEQRRHNFGIWVALAAILLAIAEVIGTLLGLPVVTRLLGLD